MLTPEDEKLVEKLYGTVGGDYAREFADYIESIRKEQPQWVSVSEQLPKAGVEVLGVLRGCDSGDHVYRVVERVDASDHDWEIEGVEISNAWSVTHWMHINSLGGSNE